jgi:serine/threonine protein kinase HipA of HipAB toxin-antitoxin module
VQVRVDQPGHDDHARGVDRLRIRYGREPRRDRLDPPVHDEHVAAGQFRAAALHREDMTAGNQDPRHDSSPVDARPRVRSGAQTLPHSARRRQGGETGVG